MVGTLKLINHLIGVSVVKVWILFKKVTGKSIHLAQFRQQLAVELCQHSLEAKKNGRKSKESVEIQM